MEQMEMSIKTEVEAAAHCDSEIGVNFFKQEPVLLQSVKSEPYFIDDALLNEDRLVDGSQDDSEQQCVHAAPTPASAGGVNETCSTSLGDLLNVKYESVEMDIGPTVLQHMDSHYTIHKNMSTAAEENTMVINCNKAMPGSGVKKENIEGDWRDGSEQQCVDGAPTLGDLLNVKYESAEMDIGPTVLQHMDAHYTIHKNVSAVVEDNTVVVDLNEAMSGSGVKKENIEGEWRDDKATSHNSNQTTTEVDYDEAHVYSHPGQQKDLQKHLLHQHRICENGCSSKADLNLHKPSHSSVELTDHLANYESETRRKHYNCDSGAKFTQRGDKTTTKTTRVHAGEKPYQCKICDARFHKNSGLTIHVRIHTGEKPYQCKICDTRFVNSSGLTTHVRVHTGEKRYQCKICDARYTQNINLTHHMRVHTGEKPYQCKICDARFTASGYLYRHMRVHTGEKPYRCKICDAKFKQHKSLAQHVRGHTGEKKPYQCKICNARFAQNTILTQHMRVHTGEKPYQCKICDARFAASDYLNKHLRVHTGEKPYQCEICDARFARISNLAQHVGRHTGVKPYQCKICDERFVKKTILNRHMKFHVGEKNC